MLYNLIRTAAAKAPDKMAIKHQKGVMDYGTLKLKVDQLANGFLDQGIQLGDRVAFFMCDCLEEILCYYACFKIGAIAVPIYSGSRGRDLYQILHETLPKMVITDSAHYQHLDGNKIPVLKKVQIVIIDHELDTKELLFKDLLQESENKDIPAISPDTIASIFYTSGTTSKPKGVVHSHQQVLENIKNVDDLFGIKETDCFLTPGALDFNANVYSMVLPCAYKKATLILLADFDSEAVLQAIIKDKVSIFFMVPSRHLELVRYAETRKPFSHHLRFCVTGGDTPPNNLFQLFEHCFDVPLFLGMGMTETLYQTQSLNPSKEKVGSVGPPLKNVSIKIIDQQNNQLSTDEIGEVIISSPTTCVGYWNNEAATQDAIKKDGWFYTGDLGAIDKDGYLWLKGRKKHIIIREGDNVSPYEVENVIKEYPDVLTAAAFGVPSTKYGEDIHAFVIPEYPCTIDLKKLKLFLKAQLTDYKVPESIIIVDKLPLNSRGKLDRSKLIELFNKMSNTNWDAS